MEGPAAKEEPRAAMCILVSDSWFWELEGGAGGGGGLRGVCFLDWRLLISCPVEVWVWVAMFSCSGLIAAVCCSKMIDARQLEVRLMFKLCYVE